MAVSGRASAAGGRASAAGGQTSAAGGRASMAGGQTSAAAGACAGGRSRGGEAGGGVGRGSSSARVAELQRARLLSAAVAAFDELGYVETSVADITGRARVSRRTFYEQFVNGDACLAAVLDGAVASIERELADAGLSGRAWCERMRAGLSVILGFLDREPALARVCVVQVSRGGVLLLERRERLLARLASAVDAGRGERVRGVNPSSLAAEGVVGAALSIVQARIARRENGPLLGLVNELMSIIVLPYRGTAAARRELGRRPSFTPSAGAVGRAVAGAPAGDPLEGVAMRLTYRTTLVLEGVAERPGASNREVGERAGVNDPGQISKLLMRLQRLGLLANTGVGHVRGEPNAWRLTPLGERVTSQLGLAGGGQTERAA